MRFTPACVLAACCSSVALGWSAHGHRVVTLLAIEHFEDTAPAWLLTPEMRDRAAYQSNECDRWRATRTPAISHENKPDHFLDVEHLWLMGMTLEEMPRLRRVYIGDVALARAGDPDATPTTYDPAKDPDRAYEYPGFLPHEIMEHYDKLCSSFQTARIIESLDDPSRAAQLAQARSNAVYHMGVLAHFVGDGAQPLHLTEHFNGWVGENPSGYTTDHTFHADIDGGAIDRHAIDLAGVRAVASATPEVDGADPWDAVLAYLGETFRLVEPLYAMEKSGALEDDAGKAFLEERLAAGGAMLGAVYRAAWEASEPSEEQVKSFAKHNDHRPEGD